MTKNPIFRGIATAIITPLTADGVDYEQFGKLIDWQIDEGINAIVACGTTGESATLTDDEHKKVISFAVERANGRVPIIAGTGSNDTDYAIEMSKFACSAGADGLLIVTPYYNKATQNGLVKMFTTIADSCDKPILLYNVPSRTGVSIEPKTYVAMAEHPNISGIKEACGNISKIVETMSLIKDKLYMYCGNDDQIVPIMSVGGIGAISVISNIMPKKTVEICDRFFAGDIKGSAALQLELSPLMNSLFSEVNPIPVKAAVSAMGYCENYLRLPLTPMEEDKKKVMFGLMKKQGLKIAE